MNNEKDNLINDAEEIGLGIPEDDGVLVLEGEYSEELPADEGETPRTTYMPRFTEASEQYRRKGDAKIRERLGIKYVPEKEPVENP